MFYLGFLCAQKEAVFLLTCTAFNTGFRTKLPLAL